MIRSEWHVSRNRIAAACALLTLAAMSQGQSQSPPDTLKVFHPAAPLVSYDVATIKPHDTGKQFGGTTLRAYIAQAYGVPMAWSMMGSESESSRVLGGPAWIDKDNYDIVGKASDDLSTAMQTMTREQKLSQNEMMEQSLLADRFHLKVHFETRDMKVFELVPAKGGLKITTVDPPPLGPFVPPTKPGTMVAGMARLSISTNGLNIFDAHSIMMDAFANSLRGLSPEVAGRPIIDKTGFTGNFDVKDFRFLGSAPAARGDGSANSEPDAPSLSTALDEKLGLKLVPAHAQVEVVVIDSIDRPSEN